MQYRFGLDLSVYWKTIMGLALLLQAAPVPVWAGPGECLPQVAGQVYLCDPLEDGSSHNGTVVGGTFIVSGNQSERGWKTSAFGNRIHYDLGTLVSAGILSFWVRGIELSDTSLNNDNHHLVEMFDHGGHSASDHWTSLGGVRVFGLLSDPNWRGKVKFFLGSEDCGGEVNLGGFDPAQWQIDLWHHIEIEFGEGRAVMRFDGAQLGQAIEYDCPVLFRHIYLPLNPWVENAIDSVDGSVYADVSFAGQPSCSDPCDDGNPCTHGDACQQGLCIGQPVEDGTPCDDQDPLTENTVCRQGACVSTCSLPEGAIFASADQTVSILWPTQPFPDESTLDVEFALDGSIEAVSYLKFDLPASDNPVELATLHVYCDSHSAPQAAGGSGGAVHRVADTSWQEGVLTWDTRPPWDPVPLDSLGMVERGQWYSFDITAAASAGSTLGLALVPNGPDGAHYLSREGGAATCRSPYLIVTYGTYDGSQGDGDGGLQADADGGQQIDADGGQQADEDAGPQADADSGETDGADGNITDADQGAQADTDEEIAVSGGCAGCSSTSTGNIFPLLLLLPYMITRRRRS